MQVNVTQGSQDTYKGGYLEGKLTLPRDHGDLRVVFSTVAGMPLNLDPEIKIKYPDSADIHHTIQ